MLKVKVETQYSDTVESYSPENPAPVQYAAYKDILGRTVAKRTAGSNVVSLVLRASTKRRIEKNLKKTVA